MGKDSKTNDWKCVFEASGFSPGLIPDGMCVVDTPVFGVDKETGALLTGMEDLPEDRMVAKVVEVVEVSVEISDPHIGDDGQPFYPDDQRDEIIRAALTEVANDGMKFVLSVAVRGSGKGDSVNRIVRVRCAW